MGKYLLGLKSDGLSRLSLGLLWVDQRYRIATHNTVHTLCHLAKSFYLQFSKLSNLFEK